MTDSELVKAFEDTIITQMRSLGVSFQDDAFNSIRAGGAEENRVVRNIARNIAQIVVNDRECQTNVPPSYATMTAEEQWAHDKAHGRLDDES